MKLLQTYATSTGSTIEKTHIYESFFPLPFDKYITFQAETPMDSRNYHFYQDVIDIILPFLLKNNISIIQLGLEKEKQYQRVVDLRGKTNIHQLAYLMKRSSLHFGPDSFGIHLASSFDVPIVGLYSISMPEVAGPHFGNPEKQILFKGYERIGNKKPSYSPQEFPKSINTIKPEELANGILKLLGINFVVPFETVHLGIKYSNLIMRELIPNTKDFLSSPESLVEIRYDLNPDDEILVHHLNYLQKTVIITDKAINLNLLNHYKSRINAIVYKITSDNKPDFVNEVIGLGFNCILVSDMDNAEIQKRKLDFYKIGKINPLMKPDAQTIEKLKKDLDKLFYKTCKIVATNGKIYASHASVAADIQYKNDFEYQRVIDSPEFFKDLDFYTIIKKLD